MTFEVFTGRQTVTNDPKVTILKKGHFNFFYGALKILKETGTTHLQINYDSDTNRIGFKPCKKDTHGAYNNCLL